MRPSPPTPPRSTAPGPSRRGRRAHRSGSLDPESVTVPVQLWHGKHETGTTLTDVLEFTDPLPLWSVTSTGGSSAILGNWTAILLAAADTFNHPIRG